MVAVDSVAALVPRAELEGEIGQLQGEGSGWEWGQVVVDLTLNTTTTAKAWLEQVSLVGWWWCAGRGPTLKCRSCPPACRQRIRS